jgi:hypothetical protein
MFRGQRKKWLMWITAVLAITIIQLVSLQQLNAFLKSPSFQKQNAASTGGNADAASMVREVSIPKDADHYVITSDRKGIAYTKRLPDSQKIEFVIENEQGVVFRQSVDNVAHMEWLGESNTLLYMLDKENTQEMYLFQMQHKEPLPVGEWDGKTRNIKTVFFSPYLESFYIQMNSENNDEIYKYKYSTGLTELPVKDLAIDHVSYDEKQDILYMTNLIGEQWQYRNGKLRDKDGKVVATGKQEPHFSKRH